MKKRKKARTDAILPAESEIAAEEASTEETMVEPASNRQESMVTRLGGFDGIMSMMGKVQKVFGFFQQMRPAFSMVSSFLGPKAFVSSVPVKKTKSRHKKIRKTARTAASAAKRSAAKRKPSSHR